MTTVKTSRGGIDYLSTTLREKVRTVTRATFWRIPHSSSPDHVNLKVGRYSRVRAAGPETPETQTPKSELTLDDEELRHLVTFLGENFEPLRQGATGYIPITESFSPENIEHVKALFADPNKGKVLDFILEHRLLPADVLAAVQHRVREDAVNEFTTLLQNDANEHVWQTWFTRNDWVLGSDFVQILDERQIDVGNIADYLMQAYDGFLDIIEIKRPGGGLRFWNERRDHGNVVPSSSLIAAVAQATAYLFEVEREQNSVKFVERTSGVATVKPRCVLIFGRSNQWDQDEKRAFRLLNASYHNITIMTYDHVLGRAQRMLS